MKKIKKLIMLLLAITLAFNSAAYCYASEVFFDSSSVALAKSTEDYRSWSQSDSRWGSINLGKSSETMSSAGCLVTSIAKLVVQCGLRDSSEFTPGTLVKSLNSNSGFTSSGAFYWATISRAVSGFSSSGVLLSDNKSSSYSSSKYNNQVISWIKDGYHLVLNVKNGGHWVAVDEAKTLSTGEIYIMDSLKSSQNADVKLVNRYSTFERVQAFKGGTINWGESLPTEKNPFIDVSEKDFFYDAVIWAVEKNITSGISADTFAPNFDCTRAEVVTFLWRACGRPEPQQEETIFADVPETAFYSKAVRWATEQGITSGYDEYTFAPDDQVTRSQFVTFLWRLEGRQEPTVTELVFLDVAEDAYYYKAILWAVENEITAGYYEDQFAPDISCTRGQVVTFLYRAYKEL